MEVKSEIQQLKARNKKVEADKAWETSWTRRIVVALITYIIIVLFFFAAGLPNPFVNSIVPAVAFLVSTATIGLIKRLWLKKIYQY